MFEFAAVVRKRPSDCLSIQEVSLWRAVFFVFFPNPKCFSSEICGNIGNFLFSIAFRL
jgi:hypothetical protein